jgi:serine beta-lactamase-like protein LACTB, mitochondrial
MKRAETWIAVVVVAVGAVVTFVLAVFAYMSLTAVPIHPSAQEVPSAAQPVTPPAWADAVERGRQIVRASVIEQNLPGISVAVGVGGEIVWAEGFGWADLEGRVPVTPHTLFKIGTASTVLTSSAVGLMLEKGRLNLDEPIQVQVPAYPEKKWPVTLRQVMAHMAGIPSDGGDEGPFRSEHCERTADGLRLFADDSLWFQPGTNYRYSNYGWILVSAAIEAAAQEPFFTFMQRQVFEPLGMADTMPDLAREPMADRAMGYFPRGGDPRYGTDGGPRLSDYSCYAGGAAFLSTPSDLVRFGMGINSGKLLTPATVEQLQTSQRLPSGEETGYGLGWDLETVTVSGEQTVIAGHDGLWMGGPVASVLTFPGQGIAVAVTSNIAYADTFGIGVKVAEAFADRAGTPEGK